VLKSLKATCTHPAARRGDVLARLLTRIARKAKRDRDAERRTRPVRRGNL